METLADYGVGSYFGLTTFTTGIYKAWLVADDRIAARPARHRAAGGGGVLLWAERARPGAALRASARV
jgi:iron(III) transport system permease protein